MRTWREAFKGSTGIVATIFYIDNLGLILCTGVQVKALERKLFTLRASPPAHHKNRSHTPYFFSFALPPSFPAPLHPSRASHFFPPPPTSILCLCDVDCAEEHMRSTITMCLYGLYFSMYICIYVCTYSSVLYMTGLMACCLLASNIK